MKKIFHHRFSFLIFVFALLAFSCQILEQPKTGWDQLPEILSRIVPPVFPDRDFLITDYGAVGDGETLCTDAFRKAIEVCNAAGGGRVVVPEGVFLTGAIHLKSNVNLHVKKEATVLFSTDLNHFLPIVMTRFEGVELMNYSPLIYAFEQENIAVTGEGTLDGQASADSWWGLGRRDFERREPGRMRDRELLFEMGRKGTPVSERIFGPGHFLRVNFVQTYKCKNVLFEDITVKRSPMWEFHPVLCTNVTVRRVKTISHGPNNDGCNPESSKDVLIEGCYFDTGDDCIAIKSGRNEEGMRIGVPSENIIVRGCTMKDGHGGVVMGSEVSGGIRNVFAEDCVMDSPNLERVLRIKSNSLRGGVVENVYMRNIRVGQVADAVVRVYFYYMEGDAGIYTPVVRNVHVENVTSEKSRYGLLLKGYPDSPVTDIYLKNCTFKNAESGNLMLNVKNIRLDHVMINDKEYNEIINHSVPEKALRALEANLDGQIVRDVDEVQVNGKAVYEFQTSRGFERKTISINPEGEVIQMKELQPERRRQPVAP